MSRPPLLARRGDRRLTAKYVIALEQKGSFPAMQFIHSFYDEPLAFALFSFLQYGGKDFL
jgi:hypothetical protein